MLSLTTGLPGNSKTLFRLVKVIEERNQQAKNTGKRPDVFYCNFLKFTQEDFDEGKCSQEAIGKSFDPKHAKYPLVEDWIECSIQDVENIWPLYENKHPVLTQGSIIVIDECQDVYPTRSGSKPVPAHINFFTKHRHTGTNWHLITQTTRQMDIAARELIQYHYELDRHGKVEFSNVTTSPKGIIENCPKDLIKMDIFKYPKEFYGLYKSSVEHTQTQSLISFIKDLPLKVKAIVVVFFVFLSFSLYQLFVNEGGLSMFSDTPPTETQQPSQDSPIHNK
ncbi:zona occludens toxin [uncultured Thiomicrorhabdus sp.]